MDQTVANRGAVASTGDVPLVVTLDALLLCDHSTERRIASLTGRPSPTARSLPLRREVVAFLDRARGRGRRVHLAATVPAEEIAAIVALAGPFAGVFEGSGGRLGSLLLASFGEGGFDFIGSNSGDLDVWTRSRRAYAAGISARVETRLAVIRPGFQVLGARPRRFRPVLRALRPHQWTKNLLVLVPALAAHRFDEATLAATFAAFVAFSLVASAVYVVNDILDISADRAHPRKRSRPFAGGDLPARAGAIAAPLLFLAGLGLATAVSPVLLGVLALYVVATTAYSLLLKRVAILDVSILALLYATRLLAGAAATGIVLSPWMLAFAVFLFLSLAMVKRVTELRMSSGAPAGRSYRPDDLPVLVALAGAAGYAAVVVLALYIESGDMGRLYGSAWGLWAAAGILLFWISRAILFAQRGELHDDPVVFAFTDRVSRISGALAALAVVASGMS